MAVRTLHVTEALASYRRLGKIVNELTLDEVIACLDLEAASQRRISVTTRLILRASSLTAEALQKKYL